MQEAGRFLIDESVAIHLNDNEDKFYCLVYMAQKLVALAKVREMRESEAVVSG